MLGPSESTHAQENLQQTETETDRPFRRPRWSSEADRILAEDADAGLFQVPSLSYWPDALQWTAMLSNFSTSYNVFNISLAKDILLQVHPPVSGDDDPNSEQEKEAWESVLSSSLLAGMMVGQIVGGALGDSVWLGRMGALMLVMALQIGASLASSMAMASSGASWLYTQLALWRFVLGIGAGGVYPLAAVLSAEQQSSGSTDATAASSTSDQKHDSTRRVVLTFSVQGLGFWVVPVLTYLLLHTTSLEWTWRILLGLGSLPGCVLMGIQWYRRRRRRHGHAYQPQVLPQQDNDNEQGENDSDGAVESVLDSDDGGEAASATGGNHGQDETVGMASLSPPPPQVGRLGWWEALTHEDDLWTKLLGTAATWFLFDVLFYGNTLFQDVVLEAAFGSSDGTVSTDTELQALKKTTLETLVITTIALPGYFVAAMVLGNKVCGIDQTPRFVMMQGFVCMGILYLLIGVLWKELRQVPAVLVLLYSLTFFFANYGPNTTTFILPSLVYSQECRSTLNGISAACGKLGALVGASLFAPAADHFGDAAVMIVCSVIALVAFVDTQLFVKIRNDDDHEGGRETVAAEEEQDGDRRVV